MTDVEGRSVLLVGSVPLESSRAVFEALGTKLGKMAKRIPDGETGARKDWVVWQADVFKNAEGLEPGTTRELQGMPVPRERDDVAYFAPLKVLKLHPRTELYLELVHRTDGL